jgi:tetratricopeptide (TPR) repeat protein
MLVACGQQVDLEVRARLDGQPSPMARVAIDGEAQGTTDDQGHFAKTIRRRAGAEVEVSVSKDAPGYRIQPWKTTFVVKRGKGGEAAKYLFDAELQATRYFAVVVTEKGKPVADAVVKLNNKAIGKTDTTGELVYNYKDQPAKGVDLVVAKPGYATWRKAGRVPPGARVQASLVRRALITVVAMTEAYGQRSGVPGVRVSIGSKPAGQTDARGIVTYGYDGEPGRKLQVSLAARGYLPEEWTTSVTAEGQVGIQRYFSPATVKPIRTVVYRFVGNTPGADLKDLAAQAEQAFAVQLFRSPAFREVPRETLEAGMKTAKLGIDRISTKGWSGTPLRQTVDMLVLGSLAKDEHGFILEAKFYSPGGKAILSQITRARSAGDIKSAGQELAAVALERFPFEGTVVAAEEDQYRVNLGKAHRISRGTQLTVTVATPDKTGKATGSRETAKLRVKRADESGAWTEVHELTKGEAIALGNRVVRRVPREGEKEPDKTYLILSAKGGAAPDVTPLSGVNVYLNTEWVGVTGPDGKAEVPVRPGKSYGLLLYRHGFQPLSERIRVDRDREVKEYALSANTSLFKVDSAPSGASVAVDGEPFGRTPMLEGKPVNLGFRRVKLSLGEDHRDWEEVVEFDKKIEDRTGARKIVLHKDYLRIGARAAQQGDVDAAILAYASTVREHPDYAEARSRLAQLYLDEKSDYNAAIREFENVLAVPENRQLIYKQFAVTFVNLGHAYYAKGSTLVQRERDAATQAFAKAVQSLQVAKQNTRFFPTNRFDEALHDTYYYLALSYHKLYLLTKTPTGMNNANLAWQEYFDFFPRKLEGNPAYVKSRESGRTYWAQIKEQQ